MNNEELNNNLYWQLFCEEIGKEFKKLMVNDLLDKAMNTQEIGKLEVNTPLWELIKDSPEALQQFHGMLKKAYQLGTDSVIVSGEKS